MHTYGFRSNVLLTFASQYVIDLGRRVIMQSLNRMSISRSSVKATAQRHRQIKRYDGNRSSVRQKLRKLAAGRTALPFSALQIAIMRSDEHKELQRCVGEWIAALSAGERRLLNERQYPLLASFSAADLKVLASYNGRVTPWTTAEPSGP